MKKEINEEVKATKKEKVVKEKIAKSEKNVKKDINKEKEPSLAMPIILLLIVGLAILALPNIDKMKDWVKDKLRKDVVITTTTTPKKTTTEKTIIKGDTTGAPAPVLTNDMIPVRYNKVSNKWVIANTSNPSEDYWFNYETAEWANGIFVKENGTKTRDYYKNAKPGTEIAVEDIIAYFVWIPRYSYMIDETNKIVNIKFESTTTNKSTGNSKTAYLTHPSFTYDNKELSGIWVGKYELTGTINEPTVLNSTSLVYKNISTVIDSLNTAKTTYNLFNTSLNLIRNTEWGAITYLTYSKYGVCNTGTCTIDMQTDSSTNNITGIFKLNSGSEYVMANFGQNSSYSGLLQNWFTENNKYIDLYTTNKIIGDATNDLGTIYVQNDITLNEYNPWFVRGDGSIFAYAAGNGSANYYIGYRVVLH